MKLTPFRKTITTEEEYAKALDVLSTLVDKGDKTTAEETAYLELLGTLVEDYERRHAPEVEEAVAKPSAFPSSISSNPSVPESSAASPPPRSDLGGRSSPAAAARGDARPPDHGFP